jgi:hypothetical protein
MQQRVPDFRRRRTDREALFDQERVRSCELDLGEARERPACQQGNGKKTAHGQ